MEEQASPLKDRPTRVGRCSIVAEPTQSLNGPYRASPSLVLEPFNRIYHDINELFR